MPESADVGDPGQGHPHFCDICETGFQSFEDLATHDCNDTADVATDGGRARYPYEPGVDAETVDDLDGIDIDAGEGCPHCGGRRDRLHVGPAGYYACHTCGAVWAGDREDADLHREPVRGPVVDDGPEVSPATAQEG